MYVLNVYFSKMKQDQIFQIYKYDRGSVYISVLDN